MLAAFQSPLRPWLLPPRRNLSAPRMSGAPPGDPSARFDEFTPSRGNRPLQEQLVRDLLQQSLRLTTTETLDTAIQTELSTVSTLLSDLFSRSERDIMQRNDELARRAILPDSSRWNQRLIRHAKISKMRRVQISQEQAIVDRLLRRVSRRDTRVRTYAPRGGGRVAIVMPWTSAVVVSAVMCVISLHIFETIARQIDGPMYLARFAIASSLVVTTSAYLVALRRATE